MVIPITTTSRYTYINKASSRYNLNYYTSIPKPPNYSMKSANIIRVADLYVNMWDNNHNEQQKIGNSEH